jgi:hypothetical protein
MELDRDQERLIGLLPATQTTFDFLGRNTWSKLPRADQEACRQALADLLQQVVFDQSKRDNAQENSHE